MTNGLVFFVPLGFPAISFSQDGTGNEIGMIANLGWRLLFAPIALLLAVYFERLATTDER